MHTATAEKTQESPMPSASAPTTPTPRFKRVRAALRDNRTIADFLATLARECRAGKLKVSELAQWAHALSSLARLRSDQEIEDRLAALEAEMKTRRDLRAVS